MGALLLAIASLCQISGSSLVGGSAEEIQRLQDQCHKEYVQCIQNREGRLEYEQEALFLCILDKKREK